jgi:Domain of unknown function (DUF6851)/VCPO second helical-bundle domain
LYFIHIVSALGFCYVYAPVPGNHTKERLPWEENVSLGKTNFASNLLLVSAWAGFLIVATTASASAPENVVIQWDNATLQTIRYLHPGPTIDARALAVTHTCIFDAWSAYDGKAVATVLGDQLRQPPSERTEENKKKAISFAAYRCLADLFPSEVVSYRVLMSDLGYDPNDNSSDPRAPSGVGNLAAASVLRLRHHDGSNQLGDLHHGPYSDYTGYRPANDPDHVNNVDHWQPLRTMDGKYGRYIVQVYLTPHWGLVSPFALKSGSQFRPAPPESFAGRQNEYRLQAQQLLELSAALTDEQKMIAEYWADGPSSETPPGHWCLFGQFISMRDHHSLDDDAKMFFVLSNAMLDASIAAWDAKRAYDSVRPVTAIHFLFSGQPIKAWGRFKGTQTIDGKDWQPYQPAVMGSTPNFPEFISGHSTFSAAGAEILKRFTGSDSFGASVTFLRGRSKVEPGMTPQSPLTLSWATFSDAANQAGDSRRFCGIHFLEGDMEGRRTGRLVAQEVWKKAMTFIEGTAESKLPVSVQAHVRAP